MSVIEGKIENQFGIITFFLFKLHLKFLLCRKKQSGKKGKARAVQFYLTFFLNRNQIKLFALSGVSEISESTLSSKCIFVPMGSLDFNKILFENVAARPFIVLAFRNLNDSGISRPPSRTINLIPWLARI